MTATALLDKPETASAKPDIPRAPHIVPSNLVPPPVQARPQRKPRSKSQKKSKRDRQTTSLSARYTPAALRQRWLRSRLRDMPSWLSSMVLHMTFVLTLSSLVVPRPNKDFLQQLTLSLTLASVEEQSEEETGDAVIELPSSAGELAETPSGIEHEEIPQVPREEKHTPPPEDPFAPSEETEWVIDSSLLHAEQSVDPPTKVPSNEVYFQRRRVHAEDATDDEIVEGFIQYDVGALRGQDGQVALKRFRDLDSRALPALIRGLNRSASISASCPVIVLTSTVVQKLAESEDPNSMDYALENIGRGVSDKAPHRGRLTQMLSDLKRLVDKQRPAARQRKQRQLEHRKKIENLAEQLATQGYHVDQQIAEEVIRLEGQPPQTILHHLRSRQEAEPRLTVTIAAARMSHHCGDAFRLSFGRALTRLLSHEDPQVAHNAHLALVECAEGNDLGPAVDATDSEHRLAIRRWTTWWNDFEKHRMREKAAQRLFRMAESLNNLGRREKAAKRYRELVRKYPNTQAGQLSKRRLE